MALRRFWIDSSVRENEKVSISGELFHHIRDVCRFDQGDRFELLSGDGRAYLVQIEIMNKKDLVAQVLESRALEPLRKPWIRLVLSVPRYAKVDFILEKAVELGVHTVTLVVSDYSFPRKLSEMSDHRMQRWEKINRAAAQQSGRGELLELSKPNTLENVLGELQSKSGIVGLFPYEGEAAMDWKTALADAKSAQPEEVWVFVGSEGGFSSQEVALFQRHGLRPMTMGAQVLRVETACVALVSVIKYEFGL
jgi:16S rRNA (uracil1498-N3)-methyltransferase